MRLDIYTLRFSLSIMMGTVTYLLALTYGQVLRSVYIVKVEPWLNVNHSIIYVLIASIFPYRFEPISR